MTDAFDFSVLANNLGFFADGLWLSAQLTVLAVFAGMAFGTVLALMRLSSFKPASVVAGTYVNLVRSIPLVLVIFWIYILAPRILGQTITPFRSVLVAFIIFEAAYYCEIIRAGISSVPRGQVHAARALGLNRLQTFRYVILPPAFRNMVPVLLTQAIVMFQDTSVVYVVGLRDLLTTADIVSNRANRPIEVFTFVALIYLVICYLASLLASRLRRRYVL